MRKTQTPVPSNRPIAEVTNLSRVRAGLAPPEQPNPVQIELSSEGPSGLLPGGLGDLEPKPHAPLPSGAEAAITPAKFSRVNPPCAPAAAPIKPGKVNRFRSGDDRSGAAPLKVLVVGFDHPPRLDLTDAFQADQLSSVEPAVERVKAEDVAVLILGPSVGADAAHKVLVHIADSPRRPRTILAGVGDCSALFQDDVDDDRIFYLSRGRLDDRHLSQLVMRAANRPVAGGGLDETLFDDAMMRERILDFQVRIAAQSDLHGAAGILAETVKEIVAADGSEYFIYDPKREVLFSKDAKGADLRCESVAAGLAGYIARTGESARCDRADSDPRYDQEADFPWQNSGLTSDARFMGAAIRSGRDTVAGVVTAVRGCDSEPFSEQDLRRLEWLADYCGPVVGSILQQERVHTVLREHSFGSIPVSETYRQEALDSHAQGSDSHGEILIGAPGWLKRTHLIAMLLLAAGVVFAAFAKLDDFSVGPATIRAAKRVPITSGAAGVVRSVNVLPGDRVKAGAVLAEFQTTVGPSPSSTDLLLAPVSGVVSNLGIRPGLRTVPGEEVASILDEASGYEIVAFLPASYAPQLTAGMEMVLRIQGYGDSREIAHIEHVGATVLSPREAAQYAGDGLQIPGPVIIVRAHLSSPDFEVRGERYEYRDGMAAEAEVKVRSQPMLHSLLPAFKHALFK